MRKDDDGMTEKTTEEITADHAGTLKLFYENSHLKEFKARVISCKKVSGEKIWTSNGQAFFEVEIDRTAFFPEGGGQYADKGTLDCVRVVDVQEVNGRIVHVTEGSLEEGRLVKGVIDWESRFMKMQQHTGEHIVSGIVHSGYGYKNVGFHLGNEDCTMDFDGELLSDDLERIEKKANRAVWENLKVMDLYPSAEELERMEYRSKIEISGQVRIIEIPGYDRCACCAPHVSYTGEVGIIKLTGVQRYKGGVRVTMLCGTRALADYERKQRQAKKISAMLCARENEIADGVARLKDEVSKMKLELNEKEKRIVSCKAEHVPGGKETVCLFADDLEADSMRLLMNRILEDGHRMCVLFRSCESAEGKEVDTYRYVIGSRAGDVRSLARRMNEAFEGRGGGKAEMVQGTVKGDKEMLRTWILREAGEF